MTYTRSSTAGLLTFLQAALTAFLFVYLKSALPPNLRMEDVSFFQTPSWFSSLVVLNAAVTGILGLCALWRPAIAGQVLFGILHAVCPLLFFTDLTRNPYFTQIMLLNVWISFLWIGWFWEGLQRRSFSIPRTPLDLPLFAFLGIATISWVFSFRTHLDAFHPAMFWEGLRAWLFWAVNAMAVFYLAAMLEEKWKRRLMWVTFWIAGIAAGYGLMQFYGIERIWQKTLTPFGNRPVSTFGNPNFLSSYLLLVIPLLAVSTLTARKPFKVAVSLALLLITVTGLIATMTRSTWLGSFVSLAMLPLVGEIRSFIRAHAKRFFLFLGIILAGVLFWPQSKLGGYRTPWERLFELREIAMKKGYHPWDQRILIWSCSYQMVRDHFFFGKGWGLMELFYPYYQGRMLFHPVLGQFRTHANNSHNEVLEVWSQTGILGMGIYVWLWIVLIGWGVRVARMSPSPEEPRAPPRGAKPAAETLRDAPALWGWSLAAAAVGMFVDNFFGNVSLHFAVPGMLFWWQAGLLFGLLRQDPVKAGAENALEDRVFRIESAEAKALLCCGMVFFAGAATYYFRREFQEIFYFNGFKLSKSNASLDSARESLEEAWRWFPREVNGNYEMANTYARLSHQAGQSGLGQQVDAWRRKSVWGYLESLRANCGYDEIFFNLGATQTQMGWNEDSFADFTVETPRGGVKTEETAAVRGSIYNFSRALAINPMSMDAYNFLGNVFLQDRARYQKQAEALFNQAVRFFPINKDFWVNLAFLHIQAKEYDPAYAALKKALEIDAFYDLARRNLRALLAQMKRPDDPLLAIDRSIAEINPLIQQRNWARLRALCEGTLKVLPDNIQFQLILANVNFELREYARAEEGYRKVIAMDSSNVNALRNLGTACRVQGKSAEARDAYRRVLSVIPNDPEATQQLESLPTH